VGRITGAVGRGPVYSVLARAATVRLRRAVPAPMMRYGMPLAGRRSLVFAVTTLDQLVVGAAVGPTALGLYGSR